MSPGFYLRKCFEITIILFINDIFYVDTYQNCLCHIFNKINKILPFDDSIFFEELEKKLYKLDHGQFIVNKQLNLIIIKL